MRKMAALSLVLFTLSGCAADSVDDSVYSTQTNLYWQRCAVGAEWDGVGCVGDALRLDWEASVDACAAMGPNYRLPTLEEVGGLLGECSASGPARCAPCTESSECSTVLSDPQAYGWTWTADPTTAGEGVMVVDLGDGVIAFDEMERGFYTRCVSETP